MRWSFRADGTIEAALTFADAGSGCAGHDAFHQGYWRFAFDVDGGRLWVRRG